MFYAFYSQFHCKSSPYFPIFDDMSGFPLPILRGSYLLVWIHAVFSHSSFSLMCTVEVNELCQYKLVFCEIFVEYEKAGFT